jgi:hypothetical protein
MPIRPLPPPDVALVDPETGLVTRDWYDYLRELTAAINALTPPPAGPGG